jgi:hypothetical protein
MLLLLISILYIVLHGDNTSPWIILGCSHGVINKNGCVAMSKKIVYSSPDSFDWYEMSYASMAYIIPPCNNSNNPFLVYLGDAYNLLGDLELFGRGTTLAFLHKSWSRMVGIFCTKVISKSDKVLTSWDNSKAPFVGSILTWCDEFGYMIMMRSSTNEPFESGLLVVVAQRINATFGG